MPLDKLAALVVGINIHDSQQLDQLIHLLQTLSQDQTLSPSLRDQLREQAEHAGRIGKKNGPNPDAYLKNLEAMIIGVQQDAAGDAPLDTEDSVFEGDPEILSEFIDESLEHVQTVESRLLTLEKNPDDRESLDAVFRAFHSTKGTASFLGLEAIKRLAHHAEMLLDRVRKGLLVMSTENADLALEAADMLRQMIQDLKAHSGGRLPDPPPGLDSLVARLGENEAAAADVPAESEDSKNAAPATEKNDKNDNGKPENGKSENGHPDEDSARQNEQSETVRVSVKRLDNLINMVGELVVTHTLIAQNKYILGERDQNLSRDVGQMSKITRQLQDLTMSLRMVPFKKTFQKMERLVRDLSHKSGKPVHFVSEGEETEIDRNMVEAISDPLVHMVRNALDHGLEPPEERRRIGKPETGTFTLRAYHAAGNVVLELKDDGRGLDRGKILAKAMEKGLVTSEKELSDSEAYKLIFMPGFSTAQKVTEVSGRGVGLDVVKKNIDALRGRIDINTVTGQETTFIIRIPLTLAIIDGMLLKIGERDYILPTLNVQKAFRPTASQLFTVEGQGEMVRLRDDLLPIFRLGRLFSIAEAQQDPTQALLLVVEDESARCALLVDALLGQQQVVIRSLPAGLGGVQGLSGAAILGDGCIGFILDVASLIRLARGQQVRV